eukprot:422666_1
MSMLSHAILITACVHLSSASCPFAAMMNSYNFSGYYSYNLSQDTKATKDTNEAYVMQMCQFPNNEIYFTLAKNDTRHALIGFGSGNWSQSSMMIGGQAFKINNGTTPSHGFGIGMNMEVHKWWYQSPFRSAPLDDANAGLDHQTCGVPYGRDIRAEYWTDFWDHKRKFHRNQRVEKRKREREQRAKRRAEKKKPIYVKYYERLLDFIGLTEKNETDTDTASDAIINAKFVYDKVPDFPTLFGQTWHTEDGVTMTLIDEANGCFNGELFSNVSLAYFGVGINTFIEKENGIKNGQFFLQISPTELIGSSITFKLDDDGEITEDQIKGFKMQKADEFTPCKARVPSCEGNAKCE